MGLRSLQKAEYPTNATRYLGRYLISCGLIVASISHPMYAQNMDENPRLISGLITDRESGLPIPGVQVFYSGTTIGDVSDKNGYYVLPEPPVETIEVVLSMLGYEYASQRVDLETFKYRSLDFELTPRVIGLDGITVTDDRGESWAVNLERFKKVFFGNTAFSGSCRLTNPKAISLYYDQNDDRLNASSIVPLIFENNALGYRVSFHDLTLVHRPALYQWRAKPRFELLDPENSSQESDWKKHRQKAYYGSLRHLMRSLIRDEVLQAGFSVYDVNAPGVYSLLRPIPEMIALDADNRQPVMPVLVRNDSLKKYLFQFPMTLLIIYDKEREPYAYSTSQLRTVDRPRFDNAQTTWIKMSVPMVEIDTNGNFLFRGSGFPIVTSGYLAWERVCELLPYDYSPERDY